MKQLAVVLLLGALAMGQSITQTQNQNNNYHPKPPTGKHHKGKEDGPRQNQRQQQQQAQIQTDRSASAASNNGNSQVTNENQVRQAPFAYSPEAISTAPCRVAGSAGVSAPFGAVSVGGSKRDAECDARATAQAFALLGQYGAALQILCTTKAAKKAHIENCANLPAPGPQPVVEHVVEPAPPQITVNIPPVQIVELPAPVRTLPELPALPPAKKIVRKHRAINKCKCYGSEVKTCTQA